MELFTVASAAEKLGCSPTRIKGWMSRGLIPERRIQLGKVRARVVSEESIAKLKRVLEGIEQEGLTVPTAFARYFAEDATLELTPAGISGRTAKTSGERIAVTAPPIPPRNNIYKRNKDG